MSLDYSKNSNIIVEKLRRAHNPNLAIIRGTFFKAEYLFFRKNVRDQLVLVVGSGLGDDSFELVQYNKKVVGIELLSDLVLTSSQIKQKLNLSNVEFYQEDLFFHNPSRKYDTSILNMGTIGNFNDKQKLITKLLSYSKRVCLDFYLEDEMSLKIRKKMYQEEGWKNVKIENKKIVSEDGLESKSISKLELTKIIHELECSVVYHYLTDFSMMAAISHR